MEMNKETLNDKEVIALINNNLIPVKIDSRTKETIVYNGKIDTIFREKQQVKQVNNGQECGITIKDYMDFQKNDTIEAFNVISKERTV